MAIRVGEAQGRGTAPNINVTPLVDVVLVLLIIFMVITPLLEKKFWVHTPKEEQVEAPPSDEPLVLRVLSGGELEINGLRIARNELADRLPRLFAAREDHVLFVGAADDVPYGVVVSIMDAARGAGAVTIAPLTRPVEGTVAAGRTEGS